MTRARTSEEAGRARAESDAEGDGRWARLSPCPPNSFDHGILPSNIYLPGIYKKDEVLE